MLLVNALPCDAHQLSHKTDGKPDATERLPVYSTLYFDHHFSTLTGVSVSHSLMEGYSLLWPHQGYLAHTRPYKQDSTPSLDIERLAHMCVDFCVSGIASIANHEIFGHGFRLREIGFNKIKYGIFYAVPNSATQIMSFKKKLSPKVFVQKEIIAHMGGIESSQVMAQQMTLQYLRQQRIVPIQAWLFLQGVLDGILYTLITPTGDEKHALKDISVLVRAIDYPDQKSSGLHEASSNRPLNLKTLYEEGYLNDINNYVAKINELYDDSKALSVRQMQKAFLLNFLDPFWGYAWYFLAFEYLFKGSVHWQYPMISVGKLQYLPGLRCIMTPYGLEKQLVNYIRYNDVSAQVLVSYGQHPKHQSYGIGGQCNAVPIYTDWALGGRFYLWKQPQLFSKYPTNTSSKLGVMLTLRGEYTLTQNFRIMSRLGYKTQGYVQGEPLGTSFIFGMGLQLYL